MKLWGIVLVLLVGATATAQNIFEREAPRWAKKVPKGPVSPESLSYVTPTKKLRKSFIFEDDLNFKDLVLAVDRQLLRYSKMRLSGSIRYGEDTYRLKDIEASLVVFKKVVSVAQACLKKSGKKTDCFVEFNNRINNSFNVYQPDFNYDSEDPDDSDDWDEDWASDLVSKWNLNLKDKGRFTAYYIPLLQASKTPSKKYPYPLFAKPKGNKRWSSRGEIDFGNILGGQKLELYYTSNLFNNYLLHVQGSGMVSLEGSNKSFNVAYSATNKRKWRFISKYMMAKGMIKQPSIEAQRNYLNAHPERHKEIFSTCPSYVYLRNHNKIIGSGGAEVTGGRSIATDNDHYLFKGGISYVKTTILKEGIKGRPKYSDFKKMSRFMLNQDTGGAINGISRVDLFLGAGEYPEKASQYQNHPGDLYFLMLKKEVL